MITRLLTYAEDSKKHFVISIVLMMLSVSSWIFGFVGAYYLINAFILKVITTSLFIKYSIWLFLAFAFKAIFMNRALTHSHIFAYQALAEIRKDFVRKMINNPLGSTLNQSAGSYRQKLVDGIEQIELLLAHAFPEGLPYLMTILSVLVMIFLVDYRLGFLALIPIMISIGVLGISLKRGMPKMGKYYESSKNMSANIVEFIRGIEVIKIFNHNKQSYAKLENSVYNYRDFTLAWFRENWTAMAITNSIATTVSLFVLPFGVLMIYNNSLSLSKLIFAGLLCFSLSWPMTKVPHFLSTLTQINKKLEDLEKDFKEIELKTGRYKLKPEDLDISYRNVCFSYDEVMVTKNVSFDIKQGEKIAFVGESGSGKSTIIKLLMHYYDVTSGDITIGGQKITDIDIESLMDNISYVSQDNFLFDTSIKENILIGKPNASDEEVENACKLSHIHDFIMDLEKGYDTRVGDSGDKLSGGQKQRIAIARAMIKNSPIVILDEATSYTDPENEYYINQAIDNLLENKTVIIIAHKLSRTAKSDKIILVDNGEIKGIGTHQNLLGNHIYKKLWDRFVYSSKFEFGVKEVG